MALYAFSRTQNYSEITGQIIEIQKIAFDDLALIAQADNKLLVTIIGVMLHYVPEKWATSDFDHWFGPVFGFFPKAHALPAGKYYYFTLCHLYFHILRKNSMSVPTRTLDDPRARCLK